METVFCMKFSYNYLVKQDFVLLMDRILLCLVLLGCTASANAGSGFYYAIDGLSHTLTTKTQTDITYSPPPPAASTSSGSSKNTYSDVGIRYGYKYKRRLTHSTFIVPELHLSNFKSDDLIYGTNFKFGAEISRLAVFGIVGVSRIDLLDKNVLTYGVGSEYNISDTISINLEWQHFDTMNEETTAISYFGAQTVTTDTVTTRDIDVYKIGISFYFHE